DVLGEHLRGLGQWCGDAVADGGGDHGMAGEVAGIGDDAGRGGEGDGVVPGDGLGAAGGGDLQDEGGGAVALGAVAGDVAVGEEAAGTGDRLSVDGAGAGGGAGQAVGGERLVV